MTDEVDLNEGRTSRNVVRDEDRERINLLARKCIQLAEYDLEGIAKNTVEAHSALISSLVGQFCFTYGYENTVFFLEQQINLMKNDEAFNENYDSYQ